MSMPKFRLPSDPDKRMMTAAMLTCAITNMECGNEEACKRVHALYEELLGASSEDSTFVWDKLADD